MQIRIQFYTVLYLITSAYSFTMFIDSLTLSTDQTLQPNTLYTLKANLNSNNIPAGSKVVIKFSNRFAITASTLSNCQYSHTGSAPLTSTTCTSSYDSGTTTYSITFSNIYATGTTAQASIMLTVTLRL